MSILKQFGGAVSKGLVQQYGQSLNWKNGKFENLVTTTMDFKVQNVPGLLYKQIFQTAGRSPKKSLPIMTFDKEVFMQPSDQVKMIWYGHSVVLMNIQQKIFLIDPMLGPDAAPIAPFASKRFSANTLDLIDQFPPIDMVLITHDHYDHLDLASIEKLKSKVKNFGVALGVKRHLIKWGVDAACIEEFDWWDQKIVDDVTITFTPTRHFSGRGLTDRAKSLWGGWAFKTPTENIYFSGDGGYGDHFKEVGERLGPFDFGFMECGQFNENWHQIHMFPEESVQAAIDAKVKNTMPVHWAGFALALHHWKYPVEEYLKFAKEKDVQVINPKLGQYFLSDQVIDHKWWADLV